MGALLLLVGCGLAGCSGRANEAAAPSAAPAAGAGATGAGAPAAVGGASRTPLAAVDARQVVSTATLRIEVPDVTAAASRAGRLAVEAGGFVAGSDESGTGRERRGQVTLKVPGDRFDQLVGAVSGLGEVRSKQVGTEDVTDQVVDLEARLRAGRAAADRLQQLITRAATVAEVVGVEGELAKRTAEIESLEGRLRVLSNRVDLATVTVSLTVPQPAADDELPGFVAGLRGGWRALRATAVVGSAVVGALLPWLVLAAVLGLVIRLGWRRWRRGHPRRPKPPPPPIWPSDGPPADPPPGAAAIPAPPPPATGPQPSSTEG